VQLGLRPRTVPSDRPEVADSAAAVRKRAVAGVTNLAIREAAIRGLGLIGNLVLARLLVPSDYGIIAVGYTLMSLGSLIADGGLGAALIGRERPPSAAELRGLLGFHLAGTSAGFVAIAGIGSFLGSAGGTASVMAIALPLTALRVPTVLTLEREMDYRLVVWADIAEIVVYNVVAIALVLAGLGVWGVALAVVAKAVTGSSVLLALGPIHWLRPSLRFGEIRSLLRFGAQFQSVSIINALREQGMNLVVGAVGGLATLGIWSLASRILQAIFLLLNSLWRVAYPAVARLIETGESALPSMERSLDLSSAALGVLVVAIGGTAPALVPALFTSRWNEAIAVLPWTAASLMVLGPLSTSAVGYLFATHRPLVVLRATVYYSVVWFAVSVPLIRSLGAEALGIGIGAAAVVNCVVLSRVVRRDGIRVRENCQIQTVLAGVGGAAAWFTAEALGPNLVSLGVALGSGEAVYLAGLILLRRRALVGLLRLASVALGRG